MSRLKTWSLTTLAVVLVALAVFLVPTIWGKPWSIEHFYARTFGVFALRHPMMLSSMRLLEPVGLTFHNDDLDDFSLEFQEEEAAWRDEQLEVLRSYDRDGMDAAGRLSYDVLEWFLVDAKASDRWRFHDYPIDQLGGVHTGLPDFMINTHHLESAQDAEDYVARVGQFARVFDQVLAGVAKREELGVVPPRFVIDHVITTMEGLIAPPATEQVVYTHFAEKTAEIDELAEEERDALLAELAAELEGSVTPAYGRMIDFFRRQREIATTDDGVWKLPDGAEYYQWTLRHHTTTEMTPEEIHQLGLAEVAAIQAEMREILEAEGYPTEDLGATLQGLNEEERFLYPDTAEGRERILADYQRIIDEIDAGIDSLFDVRPSVGVEVKPVPEFRQATAPGAYYNAPPFDRSKPGVFYVNLRDVAEIPKFGMRTLAYHEAVPGHHFQIAIAQEIEGVPFFRKVLPFTAYVEGWALYAEKLAAEAGFQEDPFDRLGYLTGQVFRAVRLVVDTGLHAKRWSREEAIEYMVANTGMPRGDVVAEIERYIVNPGQACAYKVGQLAILELREDARRRLGEEFDLRGFHNVLLTQGQLPLEILRREVEGWVEEGS